MLLAELCCQYSSLQAQLSWCKTKMQGGEASEMSSWGNRRWNLALTKNPVWALTKILLKLSWKLSQVWREYYCSNIQYMMVVKLDWKQGSDPQITFLSFTFARDWCPGTASRAQGYLHISFHPAPFGYFRFAVEINSLIILGRALCLAQRRAQTLHTEGHLYGLVYPGFCLGSPHAAGVAEERALCVLSTTAAGLSLSPFWLHFPLEQLFPCLSCPGSTILFAFFLSLVDYGIHK